MKKITFTLIIALFSTAIIQAQEKNTQTETITKTVTVKGLTKETTVTETTKEKKQVIEINDSGIENQDEIYGTKKNEAVSETKTVVKTNPHNDAAIAELKRKQQEEIKASKEAQKAKYDAERSELKKKEAEDVKRKKDSIHKKYQKENN